MRDKLIKVRLSDKELQQVKEAAEFAGHKLAAWARSAVLVSAQIQKARSEQEIDF